MSSPTPAPSYGIEAEQQEAAKRKRVALSFSAEELEQIQQLAGATPFAVWCKERVLLSSGFSDPLARFISQGLMAAANLRQHQYLYIEVFELGYQLTEAINRRPMGDQDDRQIRDLVDRLNHLVIVVAEDRETVHAQRLELLAISKDLSRIVAEARDATSPVFQRP